MPPDALTVAITLEQCWHRVPGGTATAVVHLVDELRTRPGVRLVGLTARHGRAVPSVAPPPVELRSASLPRPVLYESWARAGRPRADRLVAGADLVHATAYALPPTGLPVVATVHDLVFCDHPELHPRRGGAWLRRAWRVVRERADVVVCPSAHAAERCVHHGLAAERVRVVPWGVVVPAAGVEVDADRERRRAALLPDDGPYVLSVGTNEPRKNLRRLVEAFGRLDSSARLVVVGPQGWDDELGPLVAGTGGRVLALGRVDDADLDALYAGAACVAYPSLHEGFGLPVLESMARARPVLTSVGSPMAELAAGAAVLVDPFDVEAIAAGLGDLLADPVAAAELGRRGLERAEGCTWASCADAHLAIYRELA